LNKPSKKLPTPVKVLSVPELLIRVRLGRARDEMGKMVARVMSRSKPLRSSVT